MDKKRDLLDMIYHYVIGTLMWRFRLGGLSTELYYGNFGGRNFDLISRTIL